MQYQCSLCPSLTFPDKQSWTCHKIAKWQDRQHDRATYKRLQPDIQKPELRRYRRTADGYQCPRCKAVWSTKQAVMVHSCPGPYTPPAFDFQKMERLKLSVNHLLSKIEDCDYHPERHSWHRPKTKKEKRQFKAFADRLLNQWDSLPVRKERSPLQKLAYGFYLQNWERVKAAAYSLAYALVERERERLYKLILTYPGLVFEPQSIIDYFDKNERFEDENIGPLDDHRSQPGGTN